MIAIIGAMQVEIEGLLKKLAELTAKKVGALTIYKGQLKQKDTKKIVDVVVCKCGVGKVFSSLATATIMQMYPKVSLVINLGVAGGLANDLNQGDFALATGAIQHDFLALEGGYGLVAGYQEREFTVCSSAASKMQDALESLGFKYKTGIIVSGDQFIQDKNKTAWLKKEFNAIACDMETAAIAQVCDVFSVPFLGIRSISDNADGGAMLDFLEFCDVAAERSIMAVTKFLGG